MTQTLTHEQQAILRPLLERREALRRELAQLEAGIYTAVQMAVGERTDGLEFDPATMTVSRNGDGLEAALEHALARGAGPDDSTTTKQGED